MPKIKKGDKVTIISGFHKGKSGIVKEILTKKNQIIVEKINLKTKHYKPIREQEKGRIELIEAPIHKSNIKQNKK